MKLDDVKNSLQISDEKVEEDRQKMKKEDMRKERYLSKLHSLTIAERKELFLSIKKKYDSNEYRDRELKAGYYESRNSLYDLIFEYGLKYGRSCSYKNNGYFPEEQYHIDDDFIIAAVYGQGSFIYLKVLVENEVVPHTDETDCPITIKDPNGEVVICTESEYVLTDILAQIKKKELEGYTLTYKKETYNINIDGTLKGIYRTSIFKNTFENLNFLLLE